MVNNLIMILHFPDSDGEEFVYLFNICIYIFFTFACVCMAQVMYVHVYECLHVCRQYVHMEV